MLGNDGSYKFSPERKDPSSEPKIVQENLSLQPEEGTVPDASAMIQRKSSVRLEFRFFKTVNFSRVSAKR